MATRDLGTKYACFKCATKFYDMRKPAPVCPKCGADQRDQPVPTKASAKRAAAARAEAAAEPDELPEEGEEEDDDDEDDDDDDAA